MADENYTDDDIERMVQDIYRKADVELDDSTTGVMRQINLQASKERSSRSLLESNQPTMKTIKERSESPPSIVHTGSDDSRSHDSLSPGDSRSYSGSRSYSRSPGDSRSYSGSRSYSRSPDSRSYSGSRSYSRSPGDSRSRSGSRSYSTSRRSYSYSRSDSRSYSDRSPPPSSEGSRSSYSSQGSRSRSPSGSQSYYSQELAPRQQGPAPLLAPDEELSVAPKPDDVDSDLSSDNWRRRYANCSVAAIAIIVFLIIGAGLGIGFGVAAANKKDQPAASNGNGSDKEDKGVVGGVTLLDAKEFFLFGSEEMAATTEVVDVAACLEFCKEYDAMQYLYVQDSCACYNSVSCLMPWGPKVDTTNYQFVGDLYTKDELEECSEDYCQALDNKDGLCFTANSQNYQEYSLHGENMVERDNQEVETLEECLDLCSPYDAASFLNWKDCTCYGQAECWLEWGGSVETQLLLGTVYSKKPLDVCAGNYCQVNKDASCFSANRKDVKEYTVHGATLIEYNSTSASSEEECLELCAAYDAASFRRPNVCTCFENPTCWVEWGENVDTELFFGNIFSKFPLDICLQDYCELNTEDSLCFTGNEQDCREYALYGDSMVAMASEKTGDLQKCLDLCAPYDAAAFGNLEDCGCYNFAQCWLRWGDEVNSENFFGTIYSKRSLQDCEKDFCDTVGADGRCFTGNTQAYSSYSLFGSSLEEVASSSDVNNKDECHDFCKQHDAAQFLNFQDPKCKCYTGAECWLAWPPGQTETIGVEYTGDVYSKKELQFCSFDYCSQFPSGRLCAVGNNRQ